MSKRNPVVVVTGASAGVGRAAALRFGREGYAVGLVARGEAGLDAARREIESEGGRAIAIPTDVADPSAVEAAAEQVETELGPIDVWVNNAMATVFSPVKEITPEEFRRSTEVTYLGSVWGTMTALRRMQPRDRGHIVQVGSALAYRSIPLQAPYCGAKHALVGFLDSLRSEVIHDGSHVKLTMVHMPALNTPQFDWARNKLGRHPQPVPPIFEPEVAADAIFWAAGHPRREYFVGWPTVKAIWGQKFIPGILDHYLARFGYAGQLTDQPLPPDYRDNLFEPVDEGHDHGAHGIFDRQAAPDSAELWASERKWRLVAGGLGLAALAAGVATLARPAARAPL